MEENDNLIGCNFSLEACVESLKVVTSQVHKKYETMDIKFAAKKLEKELNEEKAMMKAHGAIRSKRLKIVMVALRAAPTLGAFAPPMSPPHRCHELTGNRKGQLSMDLDHPYRLLFEPMHDPLPVRKEGGLDWSLVTAIKILEIEDTHG